ncbi:hypothetical protein ACLUX0_08180 [Limosilactobacillus mucosae]
MGPDVDKHLKDQNATAAAFGNDLIEFSSNVGRVEIHEELIHVKQSRKYGPVKGVADIYAREIGASDILLKNRQKWKLSDSEVEEIKQLRKLYEHKLKEWGEKNGSD